MTLTVDNMWWVVHVRLLVCVLIGKFWCLSLRFMYVDFSSTHAPSLLIFTLLFSHRSEVCRRHWKIKTRNLCTIRDGSIWFKGEFIVTCCDQLGRWQMANFYPLQNPSNWLWKKCLIWWWTIASLGAYPSTVGFWANGWNIVLSFYIRGGGKNQTVSKSL